MRILYYYSSLQFDTGSPKALVGLIDALDRQRQTPLFLAGREGPLVAELRKRGVEVVAAPAGSISWRRPREAWRRVAAAIAILRRHRIDALHVNEFGWNLDIVLGAALIGVPVVLHVHNPLVVDWQNLNRLAATKVVFVSQAHLGATGYLGRIRRKATVLYNGVDIARFASGRSIRPSLGLAQDALVIATICQITPNKGLDELLDVARELIPRWDGLQFIVVGRPGQGYEAYAEEVFSAAATPPLAGRVHFLGSRQDIPDLLASADIFFLPTRGETFGIVVAEAMAAGLPVVSTEVGGIGEIIRSPEEGCLLGPGDRPGFVNALEALLRSPSARGTMGKRATAAAADRFGMDAFAGSLEALYEEVGRGQRAE